LPFLSTHNSSTPPSLQILRTLSQQFVVLPPPSSNQELEKVSQSYEDYDGGVEDRGGGKAEGLHQGPAQGRADEAAAEVGRRPHA